jgi:glucokinase
MYHANVVAVEIGGTKLQAVRVACDGSLHGELRRERVNPACGAQGIMDWLDTTLPNLLAEGGADIQAIAVGFGGPVHTATGTPLISHQVRGWEEQPLRHWLERRFQLRAFVFNDANAAGWAEYRLGVGRGTRHFVYMNIGSGIGGAFVLDGRLYDGQGRGAAEIGHTYVPDWQSAVPGSIIKLEDLCSGWAIERRMRAWPVPTPGTPLHTLCEGTPEALTCALLAEAARQGDPLARAEMDRVAGSVAIALANVIALVQPERIALGGGVSLMGEVLLNPLRTHLETLVFGPCRGRYELSPCALEENVVLAGAALLAFTELERSG